MGGWGLIDSGSRGSVSAHGEHTTMPIEHSPEADVPHNHVPLSPENLSWLAGEDTTFDTIVRLERIRREHADEYAALMVAAENDVKRRVLASLAHRNGIVLTYTALGKNVPDVSMRTLRKHVNELARAGILTVGNGKPSAISFRSEAVELLANDVLHYVFRAEPDR